MKLTALRLHNVRRFAGRGVAIEEIGDGVNVLCAANEFGKSTCFDALYALFFQPHSGTPGAVQSLRPYSGGNPLVEADIVTVDGRFRLSKRYYGGRRAAVTDLASGRLVAQADEAEAFIAELVRGGTGGPAGLLWVRQGRTGYEKQTKSDEGERQAREDVLSSVKGEVEALTGGQRMAEILAACDGELSRFVTPTGRPKAGGPYALAVDEREKLDHAEKDVTDKVESLREALDERRKLRVQLSELEAPEASATRRRDFEAAEAAHTEAKARGESLTRLSENAALLRASRDNAQARLAAHRDALSRATVLGLARAESLARRDSALDRQRLAIAESDRAAGDTEAAEREEAEAGRLVTCFEDARRARDAAERLEKLRGGLEKAEVARSEVERRHAAFDALAVPEDALPRLDELEVEIAGARAAEAARSPVARMEYRDGAAGAVAIDGTPMMDGEDIRLVGGVTLDIAGIGALSIRAERPASPTRLAASLDKRRDLLAALGVTSIAQARERQEAARQGAVDLALARQRLALLAPDGVAPLRAEIARAEAESRGEGGLDGDPDQARLVHAAAIQRVAACRNALSEARPVRDAADKAVVAAEKALAGVEGELGHLEAALGPEADRAERERGLVRELAKAEAAFAETQAQVERLRAAATDLADTEAVLLRRRSILDSAAAEIAKLRERQAHLNGQIRTQSDGAVEEVWQETIELKSSAQAAVARFEREIAVLTRLREALKAAQSAARDHYFEPVMTELRPLMGLLFEDASVVFDDKTLLPKSVRRNGQDEDVDVLSGGMREQLAVLTRLAFGRLLARDGRPAPIILDDALVYSDDDRIERVFDALHRQSREQQIIVFSCRQRAFARLGGHVLTMTPWEPAGA